MLHIHSFRLRLSEKLPDTTGLGVRYRSYEEIHKIPDKLRWCRYSRGLTQTEAAAAAGVPRHVYLRMEEGTLQHLSEETAQRLARFYDVPVTDLLDEFALFLRDGQAQRILGYRNRLGMSRGTFAQFTGIPLRSLQNWESNQKTISRSSWERYFKDKA